MYTSSVDRIKGDSLHVSYHARSTSLIERASDKGHLMGRSHNFSPIGHLINPMEFRECRDLSFAA